MPTKTRKLKAPKKFTIDRARWGQGEDIDGNSVCPLLHDDETGKMCCLGIYARACGVKVAELGDVGMPIGLERSFDLPEWLTGSPSEQFAIANDHGKPNTKKRELKVAKLFKEQGVEVVFKGEYT